MKVHENIGERLWSWVEEQPMFFVSTAPTGPDGHINVSPKGMAGSFAILDPLRVAYLDYTGSGAETVAHLRDNGRIVIMFCAFAGPPQIVRLHGTGRAVFPSDRGFAPYRFSPSLILRQSSTRTRMQRRVRLLGPTHRGRVR